jgi:Holliday junction resolvase RusA-like endonuclease
MISITIPLTPVSKKNSQRIVIVRGRPMIIPSKVYKDYEKAAVALLRQQYSGEPIDTEVNVAMVFYMPTHRRVDLVNLQEACLDVLVTAGILQDDNSKIVACMDESYVTYDKKNPRTEITITEVDIWQD